MTVAELKKILSDIPDDYEVMTWIEDFSEPLERSDVEVDHKRGLVHLP